MNKLKNLVWVLLLAPLAASTVLSSCKPDDPEDTTPFVTVTPTSPSAAPGEDVTFSITAGGEEGLKMLTVNQSVAGSTSAKLLDSTFDRNSFNWTTYTYTVPASLNEGQTVVLTFIITDKKDQTASATATITATAGSGNNEIIIDTEVLGGFDNANEPSFYSASEGKGYKVAEARNNQAKIDMVYFYGNTNKATLAAPDDADAGSIGTFGISTWTTKNATRFKMTSLTEADFNNTTTAAALTTAYDNATGTSGSKVNNLSNGNIIAFRTAGGKSGLIKISNITANSAGTATVDVKVQK